MLTYYYIRRFIKKKIKCVSFWLHGCCGEWEGWPVDQVNHTSLVDVVTPTDRPKSVRNRCLIEHFCGVVCVVTLPFWHFCWCRGFCHRTGSDLLLFVWFNKICKHLTNKTHALNNCMPLSTFKPGLNLCGFKTYLNVDVRWRKDGLTELKCGLTVA